MTLVTRVFDFFFVFSICLQWQGRQGRRRRIFGRYDEKRSVGPGPRTRNHRGKYLRFSGSFTLRFIPRQIYYNEVHAIYF